MRDAEGAPGTFGFQPGAGVPSFHCGALDGQQAFHTVDPRATATFIDPDGSEAAGDFSELP